MNESERKYWRNLARLHKEAESDLERDTVTLIITTSLWRRIPGVLRFLHWIGRCEGVGRVNGGECSYCLKAAMKAIGEEWKAK